MTANSKQQTAKDGRGTADSARDPFDGAYTFRNLAVWQRAQELADEILDFVAELPGTRVAGVLSQQIVKSSSSIAANIAEGHGRFAAGAYRNHLSIARGSTTETISWLDLLRRRRWITSQQEEDALTKCAQIMRMLTAKMKELDRQTGTERRFSDERAAYDAD
jgi:four helix bundle protein